jgi:hypothetical protein
LGLFKQKQDCFRLPPVLALAATSSPSRPPLWATPSTTAPARRSSRFKPRPPISHRYNLRSARLEDLLHNNLVLETSTIMSTFAPSKPLSPVQQPPPSSGQSAALPATLAATPHVVGRHGARPSCRVRGRDSTSAHPSPDCGVADRPQPRHARRATHPQRHANRSARLPHPAKAVEFIQDIIFRIGIPNSIITNLGSNFTSSEFFDFCEQWSIQIKYASVAHPRANGQVERANGMILEALRKKLFDKNEKFAGKWIRELPYVVWSFKTQPSRALHGNTPFFMVYGSEAVLPADLKFGAPRLVF